MNLAGDTPPKMAVVPKLALVVELPRSGFGGRGFARAAALQQGSNVDANRVRQLQMDSLRDDAARRGGVRQGAGGVREGQVAPAPGARRRARRAAAGAAAARCR